MRVVVVGATGHVGSYLVPRLVAAGHQVVALSRGVRRPYFDHPAWADVERVQADRAAEDAAGTFGERLVAARPEAVIDLLCFTASSARQLVEALAPTGCYLLHCGTIWVHGAPKEVPVREDALRTPFGEYGVQKAAIEELLLTEARRGTLACTVLHPGHIVGPGWPPVNPAGNFNVEVFERLAKGTELPLPNFGLETVHHVHADDVAQAFMKALGAPDRASGESFHVVSERALTLRGYAEAVASWFGQRAHLSFRPWESWSSGQEASDARDTWEHISHCPSMSTEKAAGTLGYRPRYTSLEAVFESLSWLVDQGRLDAGGHQMTGPSPGAAPIEASPRARPQ
ncbi:MAG: NAD-dependent epimerase/dehydratase family protein [Acidimicrobiales bacterium]